MSTGAPRKALRRRLAPLFAAVFLQSFVLWVPIEKLFMSSIGFTAAGVGVMAAVYAIVVPVFEVPSGILADRWSRRGVLLIASTAAIVSVTIGGLSQNVATYMISAFFLGIFFAMQSGTFESVVYDTVVEETGTSDVFEATVGRVRLVEAIALVSSALAGGAIAEALTLRATYFLTIPFLAAACFVVFRFREPQLHKAEESQSLREQIVQTYRTLLQRGRLRLVVAVTVFSSLLIQGMLEFGALWLVALAAPAVLYGPHWAGLTAASGVGGLLGSRGWLTHKITALVLAVLLVGCCVLLALSRDMGLVIGAQVLLTLILVAVSIPIMHRLHDSVPSTVRAGVASGVGTLTWLIFVPFAIVMGFVTEGGGVGNAGWLLVGIAVVAGVLVVVVLPSAPPVPVAAPPPAAEPMFSAERFLPDDDAEWPGHWAVPPREWSTVDLEDEGSLAAVRAAIADLPGEVRQVLVLRDVEGRSASDVQNALGLTAADQQSRLHEARGHLRTRLERYVEERVHDVD